MVLEKAFKNSNCVAIAEQKLEAIKQTNHNFISYCAQFHDYAINIQWNDPAQCTVLMRGLNNEINDALTLSDNVALQFQKFVAFL
jgi:hypothetical protein